MQTRESQSDSAKSYRDWPIDETGAHNREQLVRAEEFGLSGRNHYAHENNPPYWHRAPGSVDELLVRESVGARLASVDKKLRLDGLKLFLYDAWRPREVQAYFYEVWTPRELSRRRPDLIGAALVAEVGRYWAAPTWDAKHPAPHATGAAVDLTIVMDDGGPLWMGGLFDDPAQISHAAHFETIGEGAAMSFSDEEARGNRRLLYWLMRDAGFVGLTNEWWHFSWGDQMWAKETGAEKALYGLAEWK